MNCMISCLSSNARMQRFTRTLHASYGCLSAQRHPHPKQTCDCRTALNSVVAFGIVMVARFLPYLSVVMSLVGAFMTIGISIIFPSAANLRLHGEQMTGQQRAWDTFVIVIGVVCALSGTASALQALQAKLSGG